MALRAAKVTRKGQVTIPVDLREKYDVKIGDTVLFEDAEGKITIIRPGDIVRRTAGSLAKYASNYPNLQPHEVSELAAEAIADDYMRSTEVDE